MPKEIIRSPIYECTICGLEHPTWYKAAECEQKGVEPFRFHRNQVVAYQKNSGRLLAVVNSTGEGMDWVNHHIPPERHIVRANWAVPNGNTSLKVGPGEVFVSRLYEKCYRKKCCPLCNSKNVMLISEPYRFTLSPISAFKLEKIEHSTCMACNTNFFTQPQLEAMLVKATAAQIKTEKV